MESLQPCQNLRLVLKGTGEFEFELPINSCPPNNNQITKCSQSTLLPAGVLPHMSYWNVILSETRQNGYQFYRSENGYEFKRQGLKRGRGKLNILV